MHVNTRSPRNTNSYQRERRRQACSTLVLSYETQHQPKFQFNMRGPRVLSCCTEHVTLTFSCPLSETLIATGQDRTGQDRPPTT